MRLYVLYDVCSPKTMYPYHPPLCTVDAHLRIRGVSRNFTKPTTLFVRLFSYNCILRDARSLRGTCILRTPREGKRDYVNYRARSFYSAFANDTFARKLKRQRQRHCSFSPAARQLHSVPDASRTIVKPSSSSRYLARELRPARFITIRSLVKYYYYVHCYANVPVQESSQSRDEKSGSR